MLLLHMQIRRYFNQICDKCILLLKQKKYNGYNGFLYPWEKENTSRCRNNSKTNHHHALSWLGIGTSIKKMAVIS
jgi:hypothetical protein